MKPVTYLEKDCGELGLQVKLYFFYFLFYIFTYDIVKRN